MAAFLAAWWMLESSLSEKNTQKVKLRNVIFLKKKPFLTNLVLALHGELNEELLWVGADEDKVGGGLALGVQIAIVLLKLFLELF